MKLIIEAVANGWIVVFPEGTEVFEADDGKDKDCEALQRMLCTVVDALGMTGSKHDPERIKIEVVKQKNAKSP